MYDKENNSSLVGVTFWEKYYTLIPFFNHDPEP